MSFGKDQNNLQGIPGYGQGSFIQKSATTERRPRRGGGGEPYWKGCFQLSEHTPDTVRLIRGDYKQLVCNEEGDIYEEVLPYLKVREHYHASSHRGAICSAGPAFLFKDKREPCLGCDMFWEDVDERRAKKARGDKTRGPNRMSARDQFVFTTWDYGIYFQVPQVDGNGQVRTNKEGQPYTEWVKASPNDPRYQGKPWKQGHLCPWSMGTTYKDTLVKYAKVIRNSCVSCGNQNCVTSRGYFCGNPQCRAFLFDPNNTTMTPEQQDQMANFPHHCAQCGQTLYPHEEIACSACQAPQRASIFDVDLQVMKQGSRGQQTFLNIISFSNPRPVQVQDAEALKDIKPIDLSKKFAATPIDTQRKLWNLSGEAPAQPPAPQGAPGPQSGWQPPPGVPMNMQGQPVSPAGQPVYVQPPPMGAPAPMPPQPPPMPPVPQVQATPPQPVAPPPPPPAVTPPAAPQVQTGADLNAALQHLNSTMNKQ